jgi:tRNA A37 threonylcarbamoyladenosine modification protein TsaB
VSLKDADAQFAGTGLPFLAEKGLAMGEERSAEAWAPDAVHILGLAEILMELGRHVEPQALIPSYVRPPDAKKPSAGAIVTGIPGSDGYTDN